MRKARDWLPGLLLVLPSIILIGIFVYGLIGWNFQLSMTDKHLPGPKPGEFVGLDNYAALWELKRWTDSVWNLVVFTVVFLGGAMLLGFVLALLLDKPIRGEMTFRTVYLFPMAVSFIATGIVWRWLMATDAGSGLNGLFGSIGLGALVDGQTWWRDPQTGMVAMALPAIWQLAGYVMALFLAGFRGVSEDLREAGRVDGATEWQVYRHVVLPQLRPVLMVAIVIMGHMSLKVFDLIVAIAGNSTVAEVPAVYMWKMVFDVRDPAFGASIASHLLLAVAVLVIPYLVWNMRNERDSS